MTAIFTGLGSGFERGSANILGGAGQLGGGSLGRAGEGVSVNAATGNLLINQQDEFLVGRGLDVSISRTYNSLAEWNDGDNGDQWQQSTTRRIFGLTGTLNANGSTIKRQGADGSVITYTWNVGKAAYLSKDGAGAHDTLKKVGSLWEWTDGSSRIREKYSAYGSDNWRITEQRDNDNYKLSFNYTGAKLDKVTTANGEWTQYVWSGNNIARITTGYTDLATSTAKTLTRTYYGYDGSNRLTSVTTDLSPEDNSLGADKYITTYTYHGSTNRVATISQTDGSSLSIVYDGSGRVTRLTQTVASGDTRVTNIAYGSGYTNITGPDNQVTRMDYDAKKQLTKITAPPAYTGAAAQTVQFQYDSSGNVTKVTDADGKFTSYTFNADGRVVQITDPNGNKTYHWYDANGNLTKQRTYGSGVSWSNIAQYTRYTYDSENHLRYMISAEGHVTEYRYTGVGQLKLEIEYPEHIYNTSSAIPTTDEMDDWRNDLGDRSSTKILLHTYDARGNKSRIWNYGYATTAGAASNAEGYSRTYFTYDQAGQLLSTYDGSQLSETFVYDGMGRVTASTDLAGGTTSFVFNDTASNTVVTTASSYVTTSTYNNAGELISQLGSGNYDAARTSYYEYDKNGRIRQSTDETGVDSYYLYDKAGRKVADINDVGNITVYRHDAAGRVSASVSYATALDSGQIATLGNPNSVVELGVTAGFPPTSSSTDIWEWNVYDDAGRVIQTIDGTGGVAKFEYDKADRLVKTISYFNKLSTSQLNSFKADAPTALVLPTANAKDTVSRTFYDRDGRLIGSLDGEGYLSEIKYDKAGQKVEEIAYAKQPNAAYWASHAFTTLRNSAGLSNAGNIRTRYVYDGQGQLRYNVNSQGKVSSFNYNNAGKLIKTIEHAAPISTTVTDYSYDNIEALVAGIANGTNDRTSYIYYKTNGLINYTRDATGLRTYFTHDNRGQVIKTVTGTGPETRTVRNWYNNIGTLRYSVDAENYLTLFTYDKAGRAARTVRLDNPVTVSDNLTLEQMGTVVQANNADMSRTINYYDAAGRLSRVVTVGNENNVVGLVIEDRYSYSATGNLDVITYAFDGADESQTHYEYDGAGRVTHEYSAYGEAEQALSYYYYDGLGNLTSTKDPNGKTTAYTYDETGRVLTETNAEGGVTSYEYNAFGQVVKVTDPRGNASYNYYDNLGRLTKSRDAESYVTETSYTIYGEVASVTRYYNQTTSAVSTLTPPTVSAHAKDATTSFEYDKRGLVTKSTDAEGFFETYTYDAFGQRITSRAKSSTTSAVAGGTTSYAYDKRGQLISETLPIKSYSNTGSVQASTVINSFEYDARGNRTKMIEASNIAAVKRTTSYVYDKANRLTETIGQTFLGQTPHEYIAYDARGNVTRTTDAAGAKTVFFYDDLNRKTVEINALGTYTKYTYDKNGNVTEARVYENTAAVPADGGSQEEQPAAPSGASRVTSFTYDDINRMLTSSVTGATTGYWNGSSWVQATSALTTTYQYDANGNVVKMTDPSSNTTWSYYDKSGRKTEQVDGERYRTDWTYDSEGNVLTERRYINQTANPTSTTNPPAVTANNDIDRITNFTYDEIGNRLTETRVKVQIFNASTGTQTALNVSPDATIRYTYNGLGQVVTKEESTGFATTTTGDETTTYKYDAGGRLTEEKRASFTSHQNATVTPEVDYYYDGLGNLSRTVAAGAGDAASRTTTYAYDGGKLATMTDAEGFVHRYKYDIAGRVTHDYYTRVKSNGANAAPYEGTLTIYDQLGRASQQYQATSSNQNSWTDSGPRAITNYNAYGEVASVAVGGVAQQSNKYDAAGRLWATNSGDGAWKYFGYDKYGNQTVAITSAGYNLTNKTFAQAKSLISRSDVNATYTQYDKRNLAETVVEEGRQLVSTATQTLTSSRSYNAFGEVLSETNTLGDTTSYTYNNMGRVISKESPTVQITKENGGTQWIKPTEEYYYDVSGRLVASRDANGSYANGNSSNGGAKTANTGGLTKLSLLAGSGYNGSEALVTQETYADQSFKTTGFDIHGDARKMIDQINRTSTQTFDKMGRVKQINHSGGLIDYITYDGLGQQLTRYNNFLGSGNKQTTDYDTQGRVISTRAFGGDVITTTYAWSSSIATAGLGTFGGWTQTTSYFYGSATTGKTLTEKTDLFGRTVDKIDLGNNNFDYNYDVAGRLTSQKIGSSTLTSYTYYNTGQVKGQGGVTGTATYKYDATGNRTYEKLVKGGVTTKNATASYDALGRMTQWTETGNSVIPYATVAYAYDANGNIRRTNASFKKFNNGGTVAGGLLTQDSWNRYDNMNRIVTEKGQLSGTAGASGTTIVRGPYNTASPGTDIQYNAAGERIATIRTVQGDTVYNPFNGDPLFDTYQEQRQNYTYDAAGRVDTIRETNGDYALDYNFDGQVDFDIHGNQVTPGFVFAAAPASGGVLTEDYTYDLLGRKTIYTLNRPYNYSQNGTTTTSYNSKGQVTSENVNLTGTTNDRNTTFNYGSGSSYALGSALSATTVGNGVTSTTTNSYIWRDGPIQSSISYKPNPSTTWNSSYSYDLAGHLTHVDINDGSPRDVYYKTDESGVIIHRKQIGSSVPGYNPTTATLFFGGRQLGRVTSGASDFAQTGRFASTDPGSGAGSYTVRQGDTLASIAAAVWGDASLWYKLAQANGLSGSDALAAGTNLTIPAGVRSASNTSGTFKVYNPQDAIGDTSPTTAAPPVNGNKCGMFGQIVLVAIAVAVTALTAGKGAPLGVKIAAAALGSAVSQAVGVATGIQEKFSFKGVALAAISAGISGGIGPDGLIGGADGLFGKGIGGVVARGALSSALTQGIGVATGLQSKFSFAGVAAAGIGAGVGAIVGDKLGVIDFSEKGGLSASNIAAHALAGAASAIANAATRSAIEGSSFGDNIRRAIPDVIGQTIGGALGGRVAKAFDRKSGATANPVSDKKLTSGQSLQLRIDPGKQEQIVAAGGSLVIDTDGNLKVDGLAMEAVVRILGGTSTEAARPVSGIDNIQRTSNGLGFIDTTPDRIQRARGAVDQGGVNIEFLDGTRPLASAYFGLEGHGAIRALSDGNGVYLYERGTQVFSELGIRVSYGARLSNNSFVTQASPSVWMDALYSTPTFYPSVPYSGGNYVNAAPTNTWLNRGLGLAQGIFGTIGAIGSGIATIGTAPACVSVIGCAAPVGFGALTVIEVDQAIAGFRTAFGPAPVNSFGAQGISHITGIDANYADLGLGFAGGATSITGFVRAGRAGDLTDADGFLLGGSVTVNTPFNIGAQRFGAQQRVSGSDYWGPIIGQSEFANRNFAAIRPDWNTLDIYTTGVIPQGTPIRVGFIGPQVTLSGSFLPGGSLQYLAPSRQVANQSSTLIAR